jgi:hypothetical protein
MKYGIFSNMRGLAVLFIFISLLVAVRVNAQTPDSSKTYHFFLEPYLLAPSMSGTTGIGKLPNTFVCVPASELFKYFKIGGMLYAEVHNNRYAFTSDLFYASLSEDASTKNGVLSGTANLKQFMWELEGLYRLNDWLEAGVGARINSITAGANIIYTPPPPFLGSKSGSDQKTNTWVDPVIVTRLKTWVNNKLLLSLRADIGGFGIGSKLSWQLQPDIAYRVSKLLQLGLGYRVISMDYEKGTAGSSDYFLYDMQEYGPQLRIGFNF